MKYLPGNRQKTKKPRVLEDGARKRQKYGVLFVLIAGIAWGFSGNCAQYLFQNYPGVTSMHLCAIRLTISGVLMMIPVFATNLRQSLKTMFSVRRDVLQLLGYTFCGLIFNQMAYLQGIKYTNSATATVFQYLAPVLIMAFVCVKAKSLPKRKETIALILMVIGVYLVATHGDIHSLYLTPTGLFWCIAGAIGMVLYSLLPVPLVRKYGAIPVMGSGMLLGGLSLLVITKIWTFQPYHEIKFYFVLGMLVLVGTLLSCTLYLLGIEYCGAVKASVIASVEPVSSVVIMVLWLGEPVYVPDLVGFVCIIATIFLLAGKDPD